MKRLFLLLCLLSCSQMTFAEIGENAFVRKVEFVGARKFSKEELLSVISTREPSLARLVFGVLGYGKLSIERDIQNLKKFYKEQRFLDAIISSAMTLSNVDEGESVLIYQITEGRQYSREEVEAKTPVATNTIDYPQCIKSKIKNIVVLGDGKAKRLVENWFSHLFDQEYSQKQIDAAVLEFNNRSGIGTARVFARESGIVTCDLEISVAEKFPWRFRLSPTYYAGEGILFAGSVLNQNILGYGVMGYADVQFSHLRKSFDVGMYAPRLPDTLTSLSIGLYQRNYHYRSFAVDSLGAQIRSSTKLNEQVLISLFGSISELEATSSKPLDVIFPLAELASRSPLGRISIGLKFSPFVRFRSWDEFLTFDFGVTYSGPQLFSQFTYVEPFVRAEFGVLFSNFVFKGSFFASHIRPLGNDKLPITQRYFLGGRQNLRGYQLFRVSPYVQFNDERIDVGGDTQLISTIVAEVLLWKFLEFKGYLFSDFGNAYSSEPAQTDAVIAASIGGGFSAEIWNLPIKMELALPVVKIPGALAVDFYFGLSSVSF